MSNDKYVPASVSTLWFEHIAGIGRPLADYRRVVDHVNNHTAAECAKAVAHASVQWENETEGPLRMALDVKDKRIVAALRGCEGIETSDMETWGAGFIAKNFAAHDRIVAERHILKARIASLEAQVAAGAQVYPQPAEFLLGLVKPAPTMSDVERIWDSIPADTCRKSRLSFEHIDMVLRAAGIRRVPAPAAGQIELSEDDVEWIVNDMGELGVRVGGQCFFCYKGRSLNYKDAKHDNGYPILHRNVGKREFGETVWPLAWVVRGTSEARYTQELSFIPLDNPKYKWQPLPDAGGAQ